MEAYETNYRNSWHKTRAAVLSSAPGAEVSVEQTIRTTDDIAPVELPDVSEAAQDAEMATQIRMQILNEKVYAFILRIIPGYLRR